MIINHKKPSPSLNQSLSRPSPSPFNSHILIVIVFIIYFVFLVLILSRQQISPAKYNTPSHIQDTTFNRNTRYIRLLILLQVLLLLQRAIILKNTIPLLLHPNPSLSTFPTILRTYSNTISTLVSRYQCHSISLAPVLPQPLLLITTQVGTET